MAAYPAACLALVLLTPETWMEARCIGFGHGIVAVPVAIGVALTWAVVRPAGPIWSGLGRGADGVAPTRRWRPGP